jgi:hypothetical protein
LIKRETSVNLLVSNIIGLMKVRSFIPVLCSVFFFLVPSLRAAEVQWPAKIGIWTLAGSAETPAGPDTAGQNPYGVMKEAGLVGTSSKTYRAGNRVLPLTLYTFHDSTGAYEGYTVLQGMASLMDTNNAVVVQSNVVLWIRGVSDPDIADLNDVLAWERSVSDGVASPPVASYLPNKNEYALSRRYALGPVGFREAAKAIGLAEAAGLADVAGFNSGAEAMFAKYEAGKNEATLLLIEYPTPQLAELHLRHLQRALHDAKLGSSSVERKGSLLSIVLAPSSAEYAEKLRGAVNYETEVTWNEPSSTATDPPITSTLVKIIIATGMFMMVTLVLGIAFGGVRVITKRLFPGKVFDRPAQMEVLQLGLSGKPIDPRDMY